MRGWDQCKTIDYLSPTTTCDLTTRKSGTVICSAVDRGYYLTRQVTLGSKATPGQPVLTTSGTRGQETCKCLDSKAEGPTDSPQLLVPFEVNS